MRNVKNEPEDMDVSVNNMEASGSDDEAEDDTIYVVERIIDHKSGGNGQNKYLIKWEGYPDSENTWEAEENIIDQNILKRYWDARKAEEKKRQADRDAKRAALGGTPPKREAKGAEKRRRVSEPEKADEYPPEGPQEEDWEPLIHEIETVEREPGGGLIVYIAWKNDQLTVHPAEIAYARCPQVMLKFYEERLRFRER